MDAQPQVLVMFVPMMDGIAAARLLRADPELTDTAIVAHTARAAGLHGIDDLFDGICAKPCTPDAFLEAVRRALEARAHPPPPAGTI